jgi:hypothetical protein
MDDLEEQQSVLDKSSSLNGILVPAWNESRPMLWVHSALDLSYLTTACTAPWSNQPCLPDSYKRVLHGVDWIER